MLIEYKNIVIRNAISDDARTLYNWWSDGSIMAHAGFPNGLDTTEEKIKESLAKDTDDTMRRLIIEYDHKAIGEMNFKNRGNKNAEIGIKLCDASMQNKGIGRVVLKLLISELFNNYNYSSISLDTNLTNKRAQHVYEILGFKKVKIQHDYWTDQLGQLQSVVFYKLLKDDFTYDLSKGGGNDVK